MDKKQTEGGQGRLPAMAPLANPYVPFQLENAPKYEARKGLVRGTLFPGLDLPFMGLVNRTEKNTPLGELMALGFAPGPALGKALRALLEGVVEGRLPNEKDALLAQAREYLSE